MRIGRIESCDNTSATVTIFAPKRDKTWIETDETDTPLLEWILKGDTFYMTKQMRLPGDIRKDLKDELVY